MKRSISFQYNQDTTRDEFVAYFTTLADEFSLSLRESKLVDCQMITEEELANAAVTLGVDELTRNQLLNGHGLDKECAALLTRVVSYHQYRYTDSQSLSQMIIMCCDENTFPVIGIDLWKKGCAALPAGLLTVASEEKSTVIQIIDAVRNFKEKLC